MAAANEVCEGEVVLPPSRLLLPLSRMMGPAKRGIEEKGRVGEPSISFLRLRTAWANL